MLSQKSENDWIKSSKERWSKSNVSLVSEEAEDIHDKIPARDAENEALNGDSQIEVTDNIKQPTLQDETLL